METELAAGRIKQARKAKGWTQERLAFSSGVTTKTVVNAENPEIGVSMTSLTKIGKALGISFEELTQEASA